MVITVESIKPIANAGNLRAFAVVNVVDKIRIFDVRIIQQPNKQPWVSMPSRAYEKDGQRKWSPTVEIMDEKLKKEVEMAVLIAFAKLESEATTKQPQPAGWK